MVLWMTQFTLAALYAFRSRYGYIVGAAAPVGAMVFAAIPKLARSRAQSAATQVCAA